MEVKIYNVALHNKLKSGQPLTVEEKLQLKKESEIFSLHKRDFVSVSNFESDSYYYPTSSDKSFKVISKHDSEFENMKIQENCSKFVTGNNMSGKSFCIFRTEDGKFIARITDIKTGEVSYIPDMNPKEFYSNISGLQHATLNLSDIA